jgi:hypothetical protein
LADTDLKGVLIAVPCYGGEIKMECHAAIGQLRATLGWAHVKSAEYNQAMCDIVDARNMMLTHWYDNTPEYDHLLMIDNDMHFDAGMISQMIGMSKPFMGAIYHKRQMPVNGDIRSVLIGEPLEGEATPEIVNGFQRWKYVGGGVMLIKRRVVTDILKKFPDINDTMDPGFMKIAGVTRIIGAFNKMKDKNGRPLSEDYSFCERWRQTGGEIWAAVDYPISHIGAFAYGFHNYGQKLPDLLGMRPEAKKDAA